MRNPSNPAARVAGRQTRVRKLAVRSGPPLERANTKPSGSIDRPAPYGIHGVFEDQGHVMTRIREEVSARMPRPEERRDLRLPPGVPVLDVLHTSLDQDGQPYELTRFVMRADLTGLLYDVPVE